jgi:hypothetical protein
MKIRNGFVSNSSTSSFVLMIKKEDHEKVMAALHPFYQACIKAIGTSLSKFKGDEVVMMGALTVQGCGPWEYISVDSVDYDGETTDDLEKDETFYEYKRVAKEVCGKDSFVTMELDD